MKIVFLLEWVFVCYAMNDVACVNELAQIKEEMIQKSDFTKLQIILKFCQKSPDVVFSGSQ